MNINIRHIRPGDLDALIAIENVSFPDPWELQDFHATLSQKKNVGFLAETHCEVVGYFIYRLEQGQYSLISMAVAPHVRRQGIGRQMFEKLAMKLNPTRRTQITITASEKSLESHYFFKSLGFKAIEVLHDFYGPGHDGYDFVYNIGSSYKHTNKQLDEACQGK